MIEKKRFFVFTIFLFDLESPIFDDRMQRNVRGTYLLLFSSLTVEH